MHEIDEHGLNRERKRASDEPWNADEGCGKDGEQRLPDIIFGVCQPKVNVMTDQCRRVACINDIVIEFCAVKGLTVCKSPCDEDARDDCQGRIDAFFGQGKRAFFVFAGEQFPHSSPEKGDTGINGIHSGNGEYDGERRRKECGQVERGQKGLQSGGVSQTVAKSPGIAPADTDSGQERKQPQTQGLFLGELPDGGHVQGYEYGCQYSDAESDEVSRGESNFEAEKGNRRKDEQAVCTQIRKVELPITQCSHPMTHLDACNWKNKDTLKGG